MFSIKPISHRMPRTADVKNVPEKNLKNVKNAKTLQKYFLNVLKRWIENVGHNLSNLLPSP